jgi:molybdate-binding protein/DNA-binding XRE family transcriptional regulator
MSRKESDIICRVKVFRLEKGWTQQELADHVAVRRQAIYDIESGRYLPNTAIALRLAQVFGCRVEDLFVERSPARSEAVQLVGAAGGAQTRLALGRVRDRLVALPIGGGEALPFGLRSADGLLNPDLKSAHLLVPCGNLEKTVILMGCDPALEILGQHVARLAPGYRVHCRFASSRRAVCQLVEGVAHVAGTHLHNSGAGEANVIAARRKMSGRNGILLGFSTIEEGLVVARGNPLGIRSVADLAQPMVRFVNREPGAALRTLLDDHLQRAGIAGAAINGYEREVTSHREGAFRIACRVADAALGFRVIAEAFGLGFVPITAVRCDLLVPGDLQDHPGVKIMLDALQSAAIRSELAAIAGYESAVTGATIAEF